MTRLWPDGIPIEVVQSSTVLPGRFIWQGQTHHVEDISKQWRVKVDWWHEPIWRDYFKVTTTTGLLVVLYHDLHGDGWYLQRLYD